MWLSAAGAPRRSLQHRPIGSECRDISFIHARNCAPAASRAFAGQRITWWAKQKTRGTRYLLLEGGGAIIAVMRAITERWMRITFHCAGISAHALSLGRTFRLGIDCSGLVQLAMMGAGIRPRAIPICKVALAND